VSKKSVFVGLLAILAVGGTVARAAERIFWAQRTVGADQISAAQPSGASPTIVADWPTVSSVTAIAVDPDSARVYWISAISGDDAILSADLDGQNVTTIVAWPTVVNPVGLTLDPASGQLFWVEATSGDDRVRRANLDGTNVTTIVSWPTVADPIAITFDPGSNRLYWAEGGFGFERIVRAETTGATIEPIVSWPELSDPVAISVDANTGRVYWLEASFGDDALRSVSIIGGTVQTLLAWPVIDAPTSLVVDGDAGLVYWTESTVADARIASVTTAGGAVTTILATPIVVDPVAIALEILDICVSALDCDDLDLCTTDTCDLATGQCSNAPIVCLPESTCVNGQCVTGCSTDLECNDNITCTSDVCSGGTCENTPDDSLCDTGLFCNQQVCDPTAGCVTASACLPQPGNPCADPAACDDVTDTCGGCIAPTVAPAGPRYLSVTPFDQGTTPVAILITGECGDSENACVSQFVQSNCLGGQNDGLSCASDADCPRTCATGSRIGDICFSISDCLGGACEGSCHAGPLGDTPVYLTAAQWGAVSVTGNAVRPDTSYLVHTVCNFGGTLLQSAGTLGATRTWADTNGDGAVNVLDITTTVDAVKLLFSAFVTREGTNIWPCDPGVRIDVTDITSTVDAVKGIPLPCAAVCP
jgi:DNA-binding beta-propeller fold protein YncE